MYSVKGKEDKIYDARAGSTYSKEGEKWVNVSRREWRIFERDSMGKEEANRASPLRRQIASGSLQKKYEM